MCLSPELKSFIYEQVDRFFNNDLNPHELNDLIKLRLFRTLVLENALNYKDFDDYMFKSDYLLKVGENFSKNDIKQLSTTHHFKILKYFSPRVYLDVLNLGPDSKLE